VSELAYLAKLAHESAHFQPTYKLPDSKWYKEDIYTAKLPLYLKSVVG